MELPLFMLEISDDFNDDSEVNYIAIVNRPAIKKNFNAFNHVQKFEVVSEDKRIVSGCFMLADTPIYRRDDKFGEYYIVFSKDTISKVAQKFFKKGYQNNVNLGHDKNLIMDNITIFESFISDEQRGVMPMKGFEDVPWGSWFGSMLVENDAAWEKVKDGTFNGFSIEGIFNQYKMVTKEDLAIEEAKKILQSINHK